jgi:hypothetical protein
VPLVFPFQGIIRPERAESKDTFCGLDKKYLMLSINTFIYGYQGFVKTVVDSLPMTSIIIIV